MGTADAQLVVDFRWADPPAPKPLPEPTHTAPIIEAAPEQPENADAVQVVWQQSREAAD
jgi:hypothetical protein